jgi:hypothetical protein
VTEKEREMSNKTVFKEEDIHKIYLEWMNETESGSYRKDRFVNLLKGIPLETQYEIEQWLVSSLAIGLEEGYNTEKRNNQNE